MIANVMPGLDVGEQPVAIRAVAGTGKLRSAKLPKMPLRPRRSMTTLFLANWKISPSTVSPCRNSWPLPSSHRRVRRAG